MDSRTSDSSRHGFNLASTWAMGQAPARKRIEDTYANIWYLLLAVNCYLSAEMNDWTRES